MKVSIADLSAIKPNHKEVKRWANLIDHFDYDEPKVCVFKRSEYK